MKRKSVKIKAKKPSRVHEINGKRTVVVDRFLESSDVAAVQELVNNGNYVQMTSVEKEGNPETAHSTIIIDINKLKNTRLIKKIMAQVAQDFNCEVQRLTRAYVTQSKFGENSFVHRDSILPKGRHFSRAITAVIFVNNVWKPEWGGELTFFNESRDAIISVSPRPKRMVLSQSEILHRAGIPTRLFYDYRMSLVIMMQVSRLNQRTEKAA